MARSTTPAGIGYKDKYDRNDEVYTSADSEFVAITVDSAVRGVHTELALAARAVDLDAVGRQAEVVEQVAGTAGGGEAGDAEDPHRGGPALGDEARDRGAEAALLAMLEGVDRRRQVTFEHRANPAQPYVDRTLHPWGVVTFRGSAYAVGHDVARDAVRTFKLSRVRGGAVTARPATVRPPEGFDLHAHVVATVAERDPIGTARLWVAQGRGDGLRRLASAQTDAEFRGRAGTELTVEMRSVDAVAREVCGLGPDAVVFEPVHLRDAVVDRLTALEGKR